MKKSYIFLCFLITFSFTSCKKDFLEVVDKTVLLRQAYVVDLETTNQFMNGVYNDMALNYVGGAHLPYPEIMADNMKPSNPNFFKAAYNWTFADVAVNGFGDPIPLWRSYYRIIRSCSFVIEKVEEFKNQNQSLADYVKGQALAVRAWIHFSLVNMFAQSYNFSPEAAHLGIPYIKSSDIETPVSRQLVREVYVNMIDDLNEALQLLPKTGLIKEKMNYQAAKALLGRIYLFKEDYNTAKKIAREIMADVPVMTTGYPEKLYTLDETEALFRMPPSGSSSSYSAVFIGFRGRAAGPVYVASGDLAAILRENINDKRKNWVTQSGIIWIISKFPKSVTGQFPLGADGDYYQTLFRTSEMCLTAAEAYAKLNMEDSARYFIDRIRLRANPSLSNITASGPALLDSIYKERRKEMCFDGLRMWDLLRWKKPVNRIDINNPNAKDLPYPNNKAIAAIPRQDVQISGLQQNPGY